MTDARSRDRNQVHGDFRRGSCCSGLGQPGKTHKSETLAPTEKDKQGEETETDPAGGELGKLGTPETPPTGNRSLPS